MALMFQELTKLFATSLRAKCIKFFVVQPEAWFSPAHVGAALGSRASVPQELRALERLEVLSSKREKGSRVYRFNSAHPKSHYLHEFVIGATTPSDQEVSKLFKPMAPHLLVAAGMLAGESRGSVDLLIVTKRTKDERISKAVKKLEGMTAVPVRYLVLEIGEYLERREGFDRVLRDIFDFHHRVILGRA